jgi:large subunit ribosomal protein L20
MRVKTSVPKLRRKRRLLKRVKGFYGRRSKSQKLALESRIRAEAFATKHRRRKKRQFRNLFILRINAACRQEGISYSRFMNGLKKANVALDRKALSELAIRDAAGFRELVELAKRAS